jgi:hypothetical protein
MLFVMQIYMVKEPILDIIFKRICPDLLNYVPYDTERCTKADRG